MEEYQAAPTCYTCFTQVIEVFGKTTAAAFGLVRQMALNKPNNTVKVQQDFIAKVTKTSKAQYGKGFAELEQWKLIKVTRNRYGNIRNYQISETNFQIFIHYPEFYKNNMNNNKMEYLSTKIKTDKFINPELASKMIKNAIENKELNLKKIKQNISKLERKFPTTVKIPTPPTRGRNESDGTKPTPSPRGAKQIDYIMFKQTPSEFESDSFGAVGTRVKLNRRTVVPKKQNIRSKLKNVVPKTVVKKPAKLKTVEAYYNSRNFVRIKRYWNSLPGLRKIADLTEKQNNTLCNSVLTVKYLLDGSLFKKGMIDIKGNKQNIQLPKDFNLEDHEINISWLLEKISQFHKIVTDTKLLPRNKDYLRKQSLGDFILGANGRSDRGTSLLFEYCCGQVKTVQEDPNPKLTKQICHQYNLYTEQDRDFTGSDISHFIKLGSKLEEFAKTSDAKRSPVMGRGNPSRIASRFFVAQEQEWRGRILKQTPAYFSGDHAWGVFQKRLEF